MSDCRRVVWRQIQLIAAVGLVLGAPRGVLAQERWYVDSFLESGGGGANWPDAFKTLQEALDAARDADPPPLGSRHEIWVAEGEQTEIRYSPSKKPDPGNADVRTVTFEMQNQLAIYGGFLGNAPNGSEDELSQRNPEVNETFLHGVLPPPEPPAGSHPACESATGACFEEHGSAGCEDLYCCAVVCEVLPICCVNEWNGGCVDAAFNLCPTSPNAYHVVTGRGLDDTAILDGFTIRAGRADDNERLPTATVSSGATRMRLEAAWPMPRYMWTSRKCCT
jgi:hypothetical protein